MHATVLDGIDDALVFIEGQLVGGGGKAELTKNFDSDTLRVSSASAAEYWNPERAKG